MTLRLLAAAILLCLFYAGHLSAQPSWKQLPGPYGTWSATEALVYRGSVYQISYSSESRRIDVYRSDDLGENWTAFSSPVPITVSTTAIDSTGALAIGGYGDTGYTGPTLFKSTDWGATWHPSATTMSFQGKRIYVAMDGSYLAKGSDLPLLRSSDLGESWGTSLDGGAPDSINTSLPIAIFPNGDIFIDHNVYNAASRTYESDFRLSTDHGITWTQRTGGRFTPFYHVVNDSVYYTWTRDPNSMHAEGWLCRHEGRDGPYTTQFIVQGFVTSGMVASPDGTVFFAQQGLNSTTVTVHRSEDAGGTWTRLDGATKLQLNSFAIFGDTILGFGRGGPYRSIDNGETWTPANTGIIHLPNGVHLAGADGYHIALPEVGVFDFDRQNETWRKRPIPGGINPIEFNGFVESRDGSLYLTGNVDSYGTIYRRAPGDSIFRNVLREISATKGGDPSPLAPSYTPISTAASLSTASDLLVIGLMTGGFHVFEVSTNKWYELEPIDATAADPRVTHLSATSGGYVYAIEGGALYKAAWTDMLTGEPASFIWTKILDVDTTGRIGMSGAQLARVVVLTGNSLRYSADYGVHWDALSSPLPEAEYVACWLTGSGHIYAAMRESATENSLFVMHIGNRTWQRVNDAVGDLPITEFVESSDGRLYAIIGTSGVYELQLPSSATEESATSIGGMHLSIVPNPVSGSTRLDIIASESGGYEVRLVDMTGRVLRSVGEYISQPGIRSITLDLNNIPSGLYRCEVLPDDGGTPVSCPVQVVR